MTVSCGRLSVEQRWFYQLFVSILVSVGNGAVFCFGIFSPFMKEPPFSYTQEDVTFVSTTGGVLSYLSLPTGYIFDHYGPRITLAIGGITSFIGWLGMYIVFREDENPLFGTSVGVISFFYGISLLSASFFETGSVLSNLEGLSLHQGRVVIIQKTFMGLGSSIISQIYIGFFQGTAPISSFFLFLAIFSLVVGLYGAHIIQLPSQATRVEGLNVKHSYASLEQKASRPAPLEGSSSEQQHSTPLVVLANGESAASIAKRFDHPFWAGMVCLAAVIIFVSSVTIAEDYSTFSPAACRITGVATVLLVLLFYVMVVFTPAPAPASNNMQLEVNRGDDAAALYDETGRDAPTKDTSQYSDVVGHNGAVWFLNDAPLTKNMFTIEMMLMWVVSFGVWGTTTVITGNSSQIYQSLDYDNYKETTNAVYVSMYGVASALGRVAVGALQPYLVGRRRHIVSLFPIAPLINIVALPLFFMVPSTLLIVPFFLAGLATGCTWGSTVLIIKALFHHSNCGKHYNVLYTAGMLTPIVMNIALFGPVYDSHSRAQGLDTTHSCRGAECVLTPLMVSLALNVVAAAAAYLFYRRVSEKGGI